MRCPGEFDVEVAVLTEDFGSEREEVSFEVSAEKKRSWGAEAEGTVAGLDGTAADDDPTYPAEGNSGSVAAENPLPIETGIRAEPAERSGRDEAGQEGAAPAPLVDAPFGTRDPQARARRLARALVSDIVAYHPERRQRSLRQGTIRHDFREEIRKSWDEYVAQVGNEMARDTAYFQEALNEILAGGTRLF